MVSRTWAPRWRQLGVGLGLDHHLIDIIECNHPTNCETCCSKMFIKWLDVDLSASWERLIDVMDELSDGKWYIPCEYRRARVYCYQISKLRDGKLIISENLV